MPTRYATIITGDDGQEIVSGIGQFEGAAPDLPAGRVEVVCAGVLIGMVRGGPVDAAGGFGFPLGSTGVNGRVIGLAMLEKVCSEVDRGEAVPTAASVAQDTDAAKRGKAKPVRAKAAKGKKAKQRRAGAAKPAERPAHG